MCRFAGLAFVSQEQFYAGSSDLAGSFWQTGTQLRRFIISHPADFLAHDEAENGIYKIKQALATAEIFGQRDDLACRRMPLAGVVAENFRVGQAETVDALLHIADEETIGDVTIAGKGGNDAVLRRIDVLIFIHEHETKFVAPDRGRGGGLIGGKIPEQF